MLESPKIPSSAELFSVDELRVLDEVGLPYGLPGEVRYARSFLCRYRVNSATRKNRYWVLPVDNGHLDEVQVGRGLPSSDFCGRWITDMVCKNIEGHKGVMLGDVDCTDNTVVRHMHMWCHKSSCPICFYRGWASRLARAFAGRVEEGVRRGLGKPDHLTVSVAIADRDLPASVLKKRCAAAAFDRGMDGFGMIYHACRIDRFNRKLVRQPHAHLLGFIKGGFDRCRECVHSRGDCASCDGFKGKEVRGYAKDGYLVKVHDVRKTIVGTAKYILGHATAIVGIKRVSLVTYWGSMSCRKYQSSSVPVEHNCPACEEEMTRAVKVGKVHVVRDVGSPEYSSVVVLPEFDEDGNPNYVDLDVVEVDRGG
jgi:hypothetical protein